MSPKWIRANARRRPSAWQILALGIGFACLIGVFIIGYDLTLRAQIFLGPDDVFFCTPTHVSAIILLLLLFGLSIPLGFIIANLMLWTVPPIRAALEKADGRSFANATAGLVRLTSVSALVLLPVYVAAVSSKVCLSESRIYYQSHLLASLQAYDLSQIAEVRPRCTKGSRGGWNIGLYIEMADGATFDLAYVEPWFFASSERILALLRGKRSNDSQIASGCPIGLRNRITPSL
jgi:hypothetical protein